MTTTLPLRVAHLTTVDMSLELLLASQLDAIVDVGGEAIGISAPGPFVGALEARGVRHRPLDASTRGWNPVADVRAAIELWRVLRSERPSVLHTHNPKPGLYGRVLGRLAGVPLVVNTVHGLYATPDDAWTRRLVVYLSEAFAARWSHVELVQNVEDVDTIRRYRLAPDGRVRHLGNGVDLARYRPDRISAAERRSIRAAWGVDDDTVVVGTVGRLVAEKGYRELFRSIDGAAPRVRLVAVGGLDAAKPDSLDTAELERARRAGAILLGHRDDVDRLLGALDLFVLASHREGQPRAAMEAAASGLPVIATDIRGCRQVVDDGITGRLVRVRDAGALRDAILGLAGAPAVRREMGGRAVQKARAEFDERDVVRRVMSAYCDVARHRGLRLEPDPLAVTPADPSER